jgi:hypothetical protein
MAAKNLPVVGEAFLGSDPLVEKVIRIAVGTDTTDGVNDVIIDTTQANILTVSDSKFMITDLKFRITAAFSAANDIQLGVSSSASLILGASTAILEPAFNAVGWHDIQINDTTADGGMIQGNAVLSPLKNGLIFPQDSSDALTMFCTVAPTNGDMEVYVFYVETP